VCRSPAQSLRNSGIKPLEGPVFGLFSIQNALKMAALFTTSIRVVFFKLLIPG
jgi:hypothetical protein